MKDEIREQLSALVDDELTELERPLLLGRLQRDTGLRACMGRYQLIGDVIRGGVTQASGLGIANRVQRALNQDRDVTLQSMADRRLTPPPREFWKPLAGFAVAASVALVALFSIQSLQQGRVAPVVASHVTTTPAQLAVSRDASQWDRIDRSQVEQRLNGYLVNHNEFAARNGMQGVSPYIRIVGFEDVQ